MAGLVFWRQSAPLSCVTGTLPSAFLARNSRTVRQHCFPDHGGEVCCVSVGEGTVTEDAVTQAWPATPAASAAARLRGRRPDRRRKDATGSHGSGLSLGAEVATGCTAYARPTMKVCLAVFTTLIAVGRCGRLLTVPRIYNALITSDEDLLSSQAYPAVSPVLRPAIFPHYISYLPPQLAPAPSPYLAGNGSNRYAPPQNYFDTPQPVRQGPMPSQVQLQDRQRELDLSDRVKNNRPQNPDIPDVPPPPLPVRRPNLPDSPASNSKPEDFPPPPAALFPQLG